ncbi:MAG: 4Fe-4S binding protein [Desulfobacterales bacterium]|nr:4Fe-4S binding protein [Desulfobacterales bacterium]
MNRNVISSNGVKKICLEAGADAVGLVEIVRQAIDKERAGIQRVYPRTKSIIALMRAANAENVRSEARYVANDELHRTGDDVTEISRRVIRQLNRLGVRGTYVNESWPMDMNKWPGKLWDVGHKTMAVEAGLGHMGLNRLVLHPEYGACISLNSLLIDAEVDEYDYPLEKSPCIECKLCAAICPTGAISIDKPFDPMACMTHCYRENMIGFQDWIDAMISSTSMDEYLKRFRQDETASMWQSLSFKIQWKCGYCMAVCPAGTGVSGQFLQNRKVYMDEIFKPLKQRKEPVYVIAGSPAEKAAAKHKAKEIRVVQSPIRRP